MLKRTSTFVLEVLPYLLSAVIVAVVVPGFVYSQIRETRAHVAPDSPRLEMTYWDHAVRLPNPDKTAGDRLAFR